MKQLLLLTFLAVASEAMAKDGQCVRERTAMVETIRAYARSEVDVLGPQGISQRVLEVIGQVYATEQYPPGLEPMALHFECGEGTGKRNENHLESRQLRPLNSF